VRWAKLFPAVIAVACVLVIIAHTPAVLTDPLATAIAQIRQNAAKVDPSVVYSKGTENPYPEETSEQKSK